MRGCIWTLWVLLQLNVTNKKKFFLSFIKSFPCYLILTVLISYVVGTYFFRDSFEDFIDNIYMPVVISLAGALGASRRKVKE